MKKTLVCFVLLLVLSLAAGCWASAEGFTADARDRIISYEGPGGDVTVPAVILDREIRTVYRRALMNNATITALTFEEGIQVLGDSATYKMSALTSVSLPDSLAILEDGNFNGCAVLTEAVLPPDLVYVGYCFAYDSALASVTFTGPAPIVSKDAFANHAASLVIRVPDDAIEAYRAALPEGLDIQPSGQRMCYVAKETPADQFGFDAAEGIVTRYNGRDAHVIVPSEIGGVTVRGIGSYAFEDADDTWRVELPKGLTEIGDSAFSGMLNLLWIELPEGVTELSDRVLAKDTLQLVVIPSSVTRISSEAFSRSHVRVLVFEAAALPESIAEDAFSDANVDVVRLGWDAGDDALDSALNTLSGLGLETVVQRAVRIVEPEPAPLPEPEPPAEPVPAPVFPAMIDATEREIEPTAAPGREPTAEPVPAPVFPTMIDATAREIQPTASPNREPSGEPIPAPVFPPMMEPTIPLSEPKGEPQPVREPGIDPEAAVYIGRWKGVEIAGGEGSIDPEAVGIPLSLTLNEDGTGEFVFVSTDGGYPWTFEEGEAWYGGIPLRLQDDGTLIYNDGAVSYIVFERDEE